MSLWDLNIRSGIGWDFFPTAASLSPLQPVESSDREAKRLPIRRHHSPTIDICEDEQNYYVSVDFPGVKKEDIKVTIEPENKLTISGERRLPEFQQQQAIAIFDRSERFFGRYSRTLQLPRDVEPSKVMARHENGVLSLTIEKIEKRAPEPLRPIAIQ